MEPKYTKSPGVPVRSRSSRRFLPPKDIPSELDGALSEPPPAGGESTENAENNEGNESKDNPPEVTVGGNEGNANLDETTAGLEEGGEEEASSGVADGEKEARHTRATSVLHTDVGYVCLLGCFL